MKGQGFDTQQLMNYLPAIIVAVVVGFLLWNFVLNPKTPTKHILLLTDQPNDYRIQEFKQMITQYHDPRVSISVASTKTTTFRPEFFKPYDAIIIWQFNDKSFTSEAYDYINKSGKPIMIISNSATELMDAQYGGKPQFQGFHLIDGAPVECLSDTDLKGCMTRTSVTGQLEVFSPMDPITKNFTRYPTNGSTTFEGVIKELTFNGTEVFQIRTAQNTYPGIVVSNNPMKKVVYVNFYPKPGMDALMRNVISYLVG